MSAVVEKNHVAAANFRTHPVFNKLSRRGLPIVAGDIPHDGFEPESANQAECPGSPTPPGGAKKIGVFTHRIVDRRPAVRDFAPDRFGRFKNQQGMAECVIADRVSALGDFSNDVRPLAHISPNQEKRCPYLVPGKHIQQLQRVGIVRPVIEGERNLPRSRARPAKRSPKPLAGGRHRLVSGVDQGGSGRSGEPEHAMDSNRRQQGEFRIENLSVSLPLHSRAFAVNFFLNCAHPVVGIFSKATLFMAKLFDLPRYIAVEGPIRVGKSTLSNILAERLNAQRVTDPEENAFLRPFYEGKPGAAFQAQFTFLVRRFEQMRALDLGGSQRLVISDFIFEKDKIFAYLNLNDQELDTYNRYYNYFRDQLPTPDLVIYLQATPEVLKKRLRKKNAAGEKAISEEYLEEVVKAYEHFFFHYTSSDLLIVNTSEIDFVERNQDLQELLRKVSEPIKGTQYFLPLGSAEAASA